MIGFEQTIQSSQNMSQKTVMTTQMQRNIAVLMLPVQSLQHAISVEIEDNPALEIKEEPIESMETIKANKNKGNESRNKSEFLEQLLTSTETLAEHLLVQLQMEDIDEEHFEIGKIIIENLDENGFFKDNPYEMTKEMVESTEEQTQEMIDMIQEMEPVGCAAHNTLESLHIQIACLEVDEIHREHLDTYLDKVEMLFEEKNERALDDFMQAFNEDINMQYYFKKLTPYPGRAFVYNHIDTNQYVIPDVVVAYEHNELVVKVNKDIIPVLTINTSIDKALKSEDKEASGIAKKWIQDAHLFIEGLQYRASALEKVVGYIANHQKEYFLGQSAYLAPLTRKKIANDLNIHESTVSRIIANKYIEYNRGVCELRFFISQRTDFQREGSEGASEHQVKTEIALCIYQLQQDGKKISDRVLSEMLAEKGIRIARRTVAKYRAKHRNTIQQNKNKDTTI